MKGKRIKKKTQDNKHSDGNKFRGYTKMMIKLQLKCKSISQCVNIMQHLTVLVVSPSVCQHPVYIGTE